MAHTDNFITFMTSWHKEDDDISRTCALKQDVNKPNATVTMAQRRERDNQGNKRRKFDIEGTNRAGESKREMAERVARHTPG